MKILIWLICLIVRSALAAEVEAVGYGRTAEEALNNAKTAAIEKIAGTFVTGRTQVENDNYRQRIDQYHGGRIRHYDVLRSERENGLIVTRILAEVDTDKVNTVALDQGADPAWRELVELKRDGLGS